MNRLTIVKVVVGVSGAFNLLTGLILLFAPRWFYDSVADFSPFNQHFLGDVGAFVLALGFGLLLIARDPVRHYALIGVAALGSLIHVGNHLYDDIFVERLANQHWLTNTLPLLVMAALLIWAWFATSPRGR